MKIFFCILFQSPHQVDIKNVVECPREFIAYFNALETTCDMLTNSKVSSRQNQMAAEFLNNFNQNSDRIIYSYLFASGKTTQSAAPTKSPKVLRFSVGATVSRKRSIRP